MSYCAIFERNLGEAIPSSSVSLCKTLFAYSVAEANGYRHGRCLQTGIRRIFFYFFSVSSFLFFFFRRCCFFFPVSFCRVCLEKKRSRDGRTANFRQEGEDRYRLARIFFPFVLLSIVVISSFSSLFSFLPFFFCFLFPSSPFFFFNFSFN